MSAFVAQNMGAGKPERARKALFQGMGTALCIGISMFCLGAFGEGMMARIFSSDMHVVDACATYLRSLMGFATPAASLSQQHYLYLLL